MSNLFGKSKSVGQLAKQTTCYATAVAHNNAPVAERAFFSPKMFSKRDDIKSAQKKSRFEELFYGSPVPVKFQTNYQNPTKYGDWATNGRTSDF